jgi:hypothetical protein
MGFALWTDANQTWAQGTHEYRPMGSAVIAPGSVFTPRDFRRHVRPPHRYDPRFQGYFASLGEMNDWLRARGSRRPGRPRRGSPSVAQIL